GSEGEVARLTSLPDSIALPQALTSRDAARARRGGRRSPAARAWARLWRRSLNPTLQGVRPRTFGPASWREQPPRGRWHAAPSREAAMSWLSSVVERITQAFVTDDVTPALD